MIDSHAHLNDPRFKDDLHLVIERANQAGIDRIINVGWDVRSSALAVKIANEYSGCFAVVGIHPHDATTASTESLDAILKLAQDPKAVAIGESGLDYYYDNSPRDVQRDSFEKHFEVARLARLPLVIHSRDAAMDTLNIVKKNSDVQCVLHCYSGSYETAKEYLKMGHYLSFAGPVTFKNASKLRDVVSKIPLSQLMIETDCPYLTPAPYRGKRNEPAYLIHVAEMIAEIKGISLEKVREITKTNTEKFFSL
ncbi:MAG: TatD family hydrolase [Firmicutes bacterium]|nr:TatD family hydrolase [Bacillota bacterium]